MRSAGSSHYGKGTEVVRIGITGSQGTGKSTLATALARMLDLPLITEQARRVAKEMGITSLKELKNDGEKGKLFQLNCLTYQLAAERARSNSGFISDRTTIDNAAYWLKWHAHKWPSDTSNNYYKQAMTNIKNYDLVIYVPPEITPADDGFRSIDREYQLEIDFYIRTFLALSEANYITVQGSVEDRVNRVLEAIGG